VETYALLALFAPLLASFFAALFARSKKSNIVGIVTSLLIAVSFYASATLAYHIMNTGEEIHFSISDWIVIGNVNIPFGIMVDQVSVVMMLVVTLVSTMVHVHSNGYMNHDTSFNRFFAYLSAFVFSMMILVMSDNFAGLFIGWEGVGLCSWLLIGFWYDKEDKPLVNDILNSPFSTLSPHSAISPSWAANEAFIMNRVADLGMLIGIFLIFWNLGSLQYEIVFANIGTLSPSLIVTIALFLFIGAMGKSAQFPFNSWLANAMEGPTPVSALIHAATMVTAGVYLVVRANEIFTVVPEVGMFIAGLGAFVAFTAASMALVATNMKKIIAYSTLSQLGYMFVAAGLGAYWIALFHLATHAFFKSVLFLGAGNVMHAMNNEINIKNMGGLKKHMPQTAFIMIIASFALAGFPFMAGFYSKELILASAFGEHSYFLWTVLWLTAGLTAFYSFRLIMYVFFGKEKYHHLGYKPHETYSYVIASMVPLAVLAVIAGWYEQEFFEFVTHVLPDYHAHVSYTTNMVLMGVTVAISLFGMGYAYYKYSKDESYFSKELQNTFLYKMLANQYYIPHLWQIVIIKPYFTLARFSWKAIDMKIIDAMVDGIANIIARSGKESSLMQSGNLSKALQLMIIGLVLLLVLAVSFDTLK
jgi:NADH-quinone oxidoreductase subunit L